jgi:hypothetical protein
MVVAAYSRSDWPGVMSRTSRSSRSMGSALLFRATSISAENRLRRLKLDALV